ncbi:signal peptidase I [Nonomuraea sp. NPDC050556]|uniref:signal peptidase I n=1 Tax=Nonomuraea sp. NPDC050556 TaxID=3364369 RepID=UPI0037AC3992
MKDETSSSSSSSKKPKKKGGIRETLMLLVLGVGIAMLLQAFVVGSFYIPSESMENTLLVNDRVFVNKLHGKIQRGDVVVFKGWDGQDTIKRVIGIGGDKVACAGSEKPVTVNGVALDEKPYLYPDDFPSGEKFSVTVPAGKLWLMGDHRSYSADARSHMQEPGKGFIAESDVIGTAMLLYWPFNRLTVFPRPDTFNKLQ